MPASTHAPLEPETTMAYAHDHQTSFIINQIYRKIVMNRSFLVLTIDSKELSYVFTDDLRCMCSLAYHSPLSSKTHQLVFVFVVES
jgi:hypothetical protein